MKMYLPFGDWSDDGHGKYDKLLIDAPGMLSLFEAQKKLKEKYGDKMFEDHFASFYEEPNVYLLFRKACDWMDSDYSRFDYYFNQYRCLYG